MPIDAATFKGEAPRIAPRLLPPQMAQASSNPRLISGNLEAWGGFTNGQAGQAICPHPATIWYMNDQLWLTWNSTSSGAPAGQLRQVFETAMASPTWPTNIFGSNPQDSPVILSVSPTVDVINRNYQGNSYANSVGDGNVYHYSNQTGALSSTTLQSAAATPYKNWQYDPRGNWGARFVDSGGTQRGSPPFVMATSDGNNVFASANQNLSAVSQFVSNTSASWQTGTGVFVFDFGNLMLSNGFTTSDELVLVYPCADFAHVLAILVNGSNVKWALINCLHGSEAVVSHGTVNDPSSQSAFNHSASIMGGSSGIADNNPTSGTASGPAPMGCLQSDLQTLWVMFFDRDTNGGGSPNLAQFVVLQINQSTLDLKVIAGLVASSPSAQGTNAFPSSNAAANANREASIWADGGQCAMLCGQELTVWTIQNPGAYVQGAAVEVDVAKEAIAGDTSWRTIFCGTDVPRFTDLGLASGLVDGSGHPITGSSTVAANAGPYPIYSRKLGVPNPSLAPSAALVPAAAGSNAVSYAEPFDNPVNWNLPANTANTGGSFSVVGGNPGAYMLVQSIGGGIAIAWKSFAIDQSQVTTVKTDFSFIRAFNARLSPNDFIFFLGLDTSVSGSCVIFENLQTGVNIRFCSVSNGAIGPNITVVFVPLASIPNWHVDADTTFSGFLQSTQWATVTFTITPVTGATTSATIALSVSVGGVVQFTASSTGMPVAGPGQGAGTYAPPEPYADWMQMKVDNFTVSGTGPAAASQTLQATTYVYTLVNDLGEESGPSPVLSNTDGSDTITRSIGAAVAVTLPGTLALSGVDITYFQSGTSYIPTVQLNGTTPSPSMNLYRAVTGTQGTQFLLVAANIAFSGSTNTVYDDSLPDTALSEVIPSSYTAADGVTPVLWAPPPVNMLGILALPNGIYAGFFGNTLCLSEQNIPHAWPLAYRLTVDYDIVGIEAIDSTVVAATKKFPYLFSGNTPGSYSQTRSVYPYACASKRSVQYLKNLGVVYATFEGLVKISGPGQEQLLTESLFSKRDWTALNPATMIGAVNDNRYFCSYQTVGGVQAAFYIDVNDFAAGKGSLNFHYTARYNDPLTDTLYMVRDGLASYPTIEGWDQDQVNVLPYSWKSKQFYVDHPTSYQYARVSADSYVSTALSLYADGVLWATINVGSQTEFSIPRLPNDGRIEKYFEFSVASVDKVARVQVVEDVAEFQ